MTHMRAALRPPSVALTALALAAMALASCAGAPVRNAPAAPRGAVPAGFPATIRVESDDFDFYKERIPTIAPFTGRSADGAIDLLALSGGGSGGAFGAGVLVGMTESGARPEFEIVTGVSTGALIAPMAYLGSAWDSKLVEAYSGEATSNLMVSRGIGVLFDVGVFDGAPLRDLVNRFVTDDLLAAVAQKAATGRLLLVATTNLDREETVIWNMGAIAMQGGARARDLFRNVLVASASVPGVFPPVMIEVEKDGKTFQEMHVDGGASSPFFIAPDALTTMDATSSNNRRANIYVVVNGQAGSSPRATPVATIDIAARSFTAILNQMTRTAILQTETFAQSKSMGFRFTSIPSDVEFGGSLDFGKENMQATFAFGSRCAAGGKLWVTRDQSLKREATQPADPQPLATAACPLPAAQ